MAFTPKKSKPPTMADVAKHIGVSRATVSMALRNNQTISETTRVRVQAAARELGYRPNPLVSALMTQLRPGRIKQSSATLALLNCGNSPNLLKDEDVYRRFSDGTRERATELGFSIEEFWSNAPGMTGKRLTQILLARGVQGVIIPAAPIGHPNLDWSHFAVAVHGYDGPTVPLPRVHNDHHHAILLACQELQRLGYQKLGIAMTVDYDKRMHGLWVSPVLYHCWKHKEQISIEPYVGELNAPALINWYNKYTPDALIIGDEGIIPLLRNAGCFALRTPGIAYMDRKESNTDHAGISQNWGEAGICAVDMVMAQLYRNDRGIPSYQKSILLEAQWIPGISCPPLNQNEVGQ